jgi:hypothetical protein
MSLSRFGQDTMKDRYVMMEKNPGLSPRKIVAIDNPRWWALLSSVVLILIIATAALSLRSFQLGRSFEVFVDEITYLRISQGVAANLNVRLYGEPFYLHPPGFFFLEGAFVSLSQPIGELIYQIYDVRILNVLLGSLSAVLIFLIGSKSAGWQWGLLAATLFALDPFVIRQNSRNLLDTATLFWVLIGYWILASGLRRDQEELSWWRILLIGLFFGFGMLTKDMALFLTLLPLAILFLLNWSLRRRTSLKIAAIAAVTYAIYPISVAMSGDWSEFAAQKLRGFSRFIGMIQETGLNRVLGPSFIGTILTKINEFGMTYVLIGLGILSIFVLIRRGGALNRLIAVWTASAAALLGYAILLGTLEEQFFYFLVVPCVLMNAMSAAILLTAKLRAPLRAVLSAVALTLSLLFIVWSSYEWVNRHFSPDNGYERVLTYLDQNLPAGDRVAATSTSAQFLLDKYVSGPWGEWSTFEELEAFQPEYVLVSMDQLACDFGEAAEPLLKSIEDTGTTVFEFHTNTNYLILYKLNWQQSNQILKN